MGRIVKSIFGGGEKPKASAAPVETVEEDKRKLKKSRSALYSTSGGIAGQELEGEQVKQRDTLLGN